MKRQRLNPPAPEIKTPIVPPKTETFTEESYIAALKSGNLTSIDQHARSNPSLFFNKYRNLNGHSYHYWAITSGHLSVAHYFNLANETFPLDSTEGTGLSMAVSANNLRITAYLLTGQQANRELDQFHEGYSFPNINTPLSIAAQNGNFEMVKLLHEAKANPNALNGTFSTGERITALEIAFRYNNSLQHQKIIQYLVPLTSVNYGMTALHFSSYTNNLITTAMLINTFNMNPLAKNAWGATPIDLTTDPRLKIFLEEKANIKKTPFANTLSLKEKKSDFQFFPATSSNHAPCYRYKQSMYRQSYNFTDKIFRVIKISNTPHTKDAPSSLVLKIPNAGFFESVTVVCEREAKYNKKFSTQDIGLFDSNSNTLVMEDVPGVNIREYKFSTSGEFFEIALGPAGLLTQLRAKDAVHGDLHTKNMLTEKLSDGRPRTRLIDFEMTRQQGEKVVLHSHGHRGHEHYAPEILACPDKSKEIVPAHFKQDCYSIGYALWESLENADFKFRPFLPLIEALRNSNPADRPDPHEIYNLFLSILKFGISIFVNLYEPPVYDSDSDAEDEIKSTPKTTSLKIKLPSSRFFNSARSLEACYRSTLENEDEEEILKTMKQKPERRNSLSDIRLPLDNVVPTHSRMRRWSI